MGLPLLQRSENTFRTRLQHFCAFGCFAISAATYRSAKCQQPKRVLSGSRYGCFSAVCRDPLGTLFGCFQCRVFGTSVGGRRDCNGCLDAYARAGGVALVELLEDEILRRIRSATKPALTFPESAKIEKINFRLIARRKNHHPTHDKKLSRLSRAFLV